MAMITLQDRRGSIDGVVFAPVFAKYGAKIQDDAIVLVVGRVDRSRGGVQLLIDHVFSVDEAPQHLARQIEVTFVEERDGPALETTMQLARGVLQQAAAQPATAGSPAEVRIQVVAEGRRVGLRAPSWRLVPDARLMARLLDVVGEGRVRTVGGGVPEALVVRRGSGRGYGRGNGNGR